MLMVANGQISRHSVKCTLAGSESNAAIYHHIYDCCYCNYSPITGRLKSTKQLLVIGLIINH